MPYTSLARVCDPCLALKKQKLFALMGKAQIANLRQRGLRNEICAKGG